MTSQQMIRQKKDAAWWWGSLDEERQIVLCRDYETGRLYSEMGDWEVFYLYTRILEDTKQIESTPKKDREVVVKIVVHNHLLPDFGDEAIIEMNSNYLPCGFSLESAEDFTFVLLYLGRMLGLKQKTSTIFEDPYGTLFLCTKHGFVFNSTNNQKLYKDLLHEL